MQWWRKQTAIVLCLHIESDGIADSDTLCCFKYKVKVGDKVKITGTSSRRLYGRGYLGAGKTFKEPTNSLTVTMLAGCWITKDGQPLPEAVNITRGHASMKPNPDCLCSRNWCLIIGKAWRNAHGGEETARPWSQYKGDIYVLGEDFTGLPLNNIGGLNLRPHAQHSDDPDYVGESVCRKAKDYFTEDLMVTYRNSDKLETTNSWFVQDGGLQRRFGQTQPSETSWPLLPAIENFSANNAKNETPEDKQDADCQFLYPWKSAIQTSLLWSADNNGGMTGRPVCWKVDAN